MEWLWMAALILANGAFSLTEMSIAASNLTRLQSTPDAASAQALALAHDPNRFLAGTQIGLTGTNLLLGMFAERWLADHLETWLGTYGWSWSDAWRHTVSLTLVTVGLTFVAIVVGEMIPKRLALTHPETIARRMAPWMMRFVQVSSPAIFALSWVTDRLLGVVGIPARPLPNAHALLDDLKLSIDASAQAGVLDRTEHRLFANVYHLDELNVGAIMTPRSEVVWLNSRWPSEQLLQTIRQAPMSRYLVAQDDLDHVLGVVETRDLWANILSQKPLDLGALPMVPVVAVPDRFHALALLNFFQEQRTHLALVVNEYGVMQGLVTLHDWLGAVVGDIPSSRAEDSLVTQRKDGSWLFDGLTPIEDVKQALVLLECPDEGHGYQTIAGLMIDRLGRIPKKGDYFDWSGWRFEVVDMERHRVDEVLVVRHDPTHDPAPIA